MITLPSPRAIFFVLHFFVWNPGCLALSDRGSPGKRLGKENSENFRTRRNRLPQWISWALYRRKWARFLKENFQKKTFLAVGRYDTIQTKSRFHFCWLISFLECLQIVSCKLSDECYSAVEGYVTIIFHFISNLMTFRIHGYISFHGMVISSLADKACGWLPELLKPY